MTHEHKMSMVMEDTWKKPPVPGISRRTFAVIKCGGQPPEACGAIFVHGDWYENPEIAALYKRTAKRKPTDDQ